MAGPSGVPARAQEESAPAPAPDILKLAVLTFEYEEQGESRIGQRLGELLAEALALNPALRVQGPERAREASGGSLPRMADLMSGEAAARLGTQLEVAALITGQAYVVGERFYVVTKVVGCASGRVFGAGADGALAAPLPEIVEALAPGVDDLLAERRRELTLAPARAREAEESLKARVRALRREKEPPPVILLVAEPQEAPGSSASAAQDRLGQGVRRIGMTARAPKAADLTEWARSVPASGAHDVPGPLRGQGMVLAMLLDVKPLQDAGALSVANALADGVWLDARDGTRLASARVARHALGRGHESTAATAARRAAQALFVESFAAALGRWEARHREGEVSPASEARATAP